MIDTYIPYGKEWEAQLMKMPKANIIDMLRKCNEQRKSREQDWKKVLELCSLGINQVTGRVIALNEIGNIAQSNIL